MNDEDKKNIFGKDNVTIKRSKAHKKKYFSTLFTETT